MKPLSCVLALLLLTLTGARTGEEALHVRKAEVAGICGFRQYWDRPVVLAEDGATRRGAHANFGDSPVGDWTTDKPGAIVFDAAHRSVLVRFPEAAEAIAARLAKGQTIEKVELILPFRHTEFFPMHYDTPAGLSFLGNKWKKTPPRWHAVAWALRRPWVADAEHGPTFNAAVNGKVYWTQYGAQDEENDRYPRQFGPAEVSAGPPPKAPTAPAKPKGNPGGLTEADDEDADPLNAPPTAAELAQARQIDGRLDITACLTDPAYGATLAQRLRTFADCGVLVRKWEVYDARYWGGGYEWGVGTGQRGIHIGAPSLRVTFSAGKAEAIALPPAKAPRTLAPEGEATALVPDEKAYATFQRRFAFARPPWASETEWQRIQELWNMGGGRHGVKGFPKTYKAYLAWLDRMLSLYPRAWKGFSAGEMAVEYAMYEKAIPEAVKDNLRLYWWAWLMPDRDYKTLVQGYIGGEAARAYYKKTRDWRGNFSVYRTYCHEMGTVNFNSWATTGTMFGGWIIGDEGVMQEAREGYDFWMTRTWTWLDGTSQESVDHYYFAHTLGPLKAIADFAPGPQERLAGRMNVDKHVDELIACWHPNLRRFISSSGRTGAAYPLYLQEGLNYIIHTLSKEGALTDVEAETVAGRKGGAFAHEFPPAQVALQTQVSPWASPAAAALVDEKPLPYEATRAYVQWGGYAKTPIWKKSYLGTHYGLASLDVSQNECIPVMAQWRRTAKKVTTWTDLGTLYARYGINDTEFLDSLFHGTRKRNPNGIVGLQGGPTCTVQGRNSAILLGSPYKNLSKGLKGARAMPPEIRSLQMSLALFNFEAEPGWTLCVDGKPVDSLPVKTRFGSRITIQDGVTYLGIIPLPATLLGKRNTEVLLSAKGTPTEMQGGGTVKVTLTIDAFNTCSDTPLDLSGKAPDEMALEKTPPVTPARLDRAVAGFVVQLGDTAEHADFAAFQSWFDKQPCEARWDGKEGVFHVAYGEQESRLEAGFNPTAPMAQPTTNIFPYRRFGGSWPYLKKGVFRNTTTAIQGKTGVLEKNGARLRTKKGTMAYLQAFPKQGIYIAFNPYRQRVPFRFEIPGGITVHADGLVGQSRIEIAPNENRIAVQCAARPTSPNLRHARALVIEGLPVAPAVTVDGAAVEATETEAGVLVPLVSDWDETKASAVPERLRILDAMAQSGQLGPLTGTVLEWHLLGPLPAPGGTLDKAYKPEAVVHFDGPVALGNKQLDWVPLHLPKAGVIDLRKHIGNHSNVCAYAYAEVQAAEAGAAELRLGSDDGIAAWFNDREVLRHQASRAAKPDQETVPITLKKGRNTVLLKISQTGGGWGFHCRVVDGWGRPVLVP